LQQVKLHVSQCAIYHETACTIIRFIDVKAYDIRLVLAFQFAHFQANRKSSTPIFTAAGVCVWAKGESIWGKGV
jgi:hypothetical protein